MTEPFHHYHARRQLERDLAIPMLDASAVTVRLRREPKRSGGLPMKFALSAAAGLAILFERLFS